MKRWKTRALLERVERRVLLSATPTGLLGPVVVRTIGPILPAAEASPAAAAAAPFTPAQIRHFYGVDSVAFNGVTGNGRGQTIAIIAYDNQPNIASDLATFDTQFGIVAPPSFIVENQNGSSSSLPTSDYDYGEETSLDVEWAHAMAPAANLLLIETGFSFSNNSSFVSQFIADGVGRADSTAGVSVVTMSYGVNDFSGESSNDSYFTTPGITYLASAGDNGKANTVYPSTSVDVVSVGGTSITTNDSSGSYGSETVWNESSAQEGATGGGISTGESKPYYQSGVTQSTTKRTAPDVSLVADPETGVYVYDSYEPSGEAGFLQIGGTSLSAPAWAGMIAIADQGRSLAGLSSLGGYTQTLPRLYQLRSSDFHDITTGNNNYRNTGGYNASTGYDLASGLGTPVANLLIPDLAGGATVTGHVFQDNNGNGSVDAGEPSLTSLAGQTVYLDTNNNGVRDTTGVAAEPVATIASDGSYTFTSLVNGGDLIGGLSGAVRLSSGTPSGYAVLSTGSTFTTAYATTSTANVALFPTVYNDTAANDAYTLRLSPTSSTTLQILVNGSVAYSAPLGQVPSLVFNLGGSGESLAVDFNNGNPVPTGGVSVAGIAGGQDGLSVLGSTGNDSITFNSSAVLYGSSLIAFSNIANLSVDPRSGTDSLTINANTVTFPAQSAGGGILTRAFSNLSVGAGAKLVVGTAVATSDRTLVDVVTGTFSVAATGTLDLGANDLLVHNGSLSNVTALIQSGYNLAGGGNWAGTGLTSSNAAGDSSHVTALGVVLNGAGSSPFFTTATPFDGIVPATTDVLVRYTYFGDANLDLKVDGSDYSLIDAGYLADQTAASGFTNWSDGNFNYDATIDGTDYSLIDNAFNNQKGATSPAAVSAAAAAPATSVAPKMQSTSVRLRSQPMFVPQVAAFATTPIFSVDELLKKRSTRPAAFD